MFGRPWITTSPLPIRLLVWRFAIDLVIRYTARLMNKKYLCRFEFIVVQAISARAIDAGVNFLPARRIFISHVAAFPRCTIPKKRLRRGGPGREPGVR